MKNEKIAELLIKGIELVKSVHQMNLVENQMIDDFLKEVNAALGAKEEEKKEEEEKKKENKKNKKKSEEKEESESESEAEKEAKKMKEEMEMLKKMKEALIGGTSWIKAPYIPSTITSPLGSEPGKWVDGSTTAPPEYFEPLGSAGTTEGMVIWAKPEKVVLEEEEVRKWEEGEVGNPSGVEVPVETITEGGGQAGKIWCAVCNEYHDTGDAIEKHPF